MTNLVGFLRKNAAFLAAGMLLTFGSSFGQTFFISIFAGEIMQTFSLTDGQWGAIYGGGTLASAVVLIWAGALTDRMRVRRLGVMVVFGLATACAFVALNTWVVLLPVSVFLLRFFGQGMMSHMSTVAMARWFVATRGKALAIAGSGYAVGEAALPLLFVWALTFSNWRALWVVVAVACLLILPILLRLLRQERTPQSLTEGAGRSGMQDRHWKRGAMLGHPLFWCMLPSLLGPGAFVTAVFFQQVHLTEVKGWSHISFVALFPLFTSVGILSMMITGWAIDRFGTWRLIPFFQLPIALSFMIMAGADTLLGAALAISLMGVTSGANSTLPAAFWAEFYGTKHIGGIKSIATAAMVLGSAIGPALTGALIDRGIEFPDQMWAISMWFLATSALVGLAVTRAARTLSRAT